jgi:hypothetical protein
MTPVLLWIGGALAYVVCCGFAWALLLEDFRKDEANDPLPFFAAAGWPIVLAIYIVYRAAMIGPRAVERHRNRGKIPHMKARP